MARRKDGIVLSKLSALAKAVMKHSHLTIDEMLEVAEHGADAGWSGFVYYNETCKFARRNKNLIIENLYEDRHEYGEETICSMLKRWECLGELKQHEIERAFINFSIGESDAYDDVTLENALAWYALEKAAHEIESMKND